MAENESIAPEDMDLVFMTDSVSEMREHLEHFAIKKFGLVKKPVISHWWLGEKNRRKSKAL